MIVLLSRLRAVSWREKRGSGETSTGSAMDSLNEVVGRLAEGQPGLAGGSVEE